MGMPHEIEPGKENLSEMQKPPEAQPESPKGPDVEVVYTFDLPDPLELNPVWKKKHEGEMNDFKYVFIRKDNQMDWHINKGHYEKVEDYAQHNPFDLVLCRRSMSAQKAFEEHNEKLCLQRERAISQSERLKDKAREISQMTGVPVERLLINLAENMPQFHGGRPDNPRNRTYSTS